MWWGEGQSSPVHGVGPLTAMGKTERGARLHLLVQSLFLWGRGGGRSQRLVTSVLGVLSLRCMQV